MSERWIALTLGRAKYRIRPDMALILEIEDEIGGLPALHARFEGAGWTVAELVTLVHILLQSAGETVDFNALCARMLEEGLPKFHAAALSFFNAALSAPANSKDQP